MQSIVYFACLFACMIACKLPILCNPKKACPLLILGYIAHHTSLQNFTYILKKHLGQLLILIQDIISHRNDILRNEMKNINNEMKRQ